MINSGIGNNDITLSVGFDYSKAIGQDAPRAAAELQKVFNNFGGKNRALIEPLGRISSSTSEFAKSLEAANARVIAFGASVGIIYNIQKAFTELVKSTIQVEKKLTDINVVLSTSSSQLRKFGDELFSIANDTGKSFEEVSNAAIEFSRQGLGVQETLKRTKDALILTRIAGIDTKDAVDALTAGVNSFSKSLIDSTQIVNKFAAVDAAFAVSSQDLAEALRRVGSSAQDAGVDLDELAGLVTSVQQTTARGGAVIGNALKTIFSRLSRGETIRELKDLGVQIDESQTGIEKLKALSTALQNVSGTQGAAIKEAAGGVYQINVVSAALGDLSKQYGIYEQALLKSRGATDEAISRNKELGTTLASLTTTTENNLVKAFSKIGNLSIDTPFRSILKGINTTLLEPMGKLGDEGGSEFVTNFFKGIGKFIEGPGLTYITLVGANLTKALVGFAGDAFKQLQRYNKDNAQLLATQKGISLELERDQNLVLGIASGNIKVADAQSLIIQRLQQDLALREKIAAISKGIGQGVIKSGIAYSAETGTPQRIRKTFASGLVPSPKEVFAESLGAMDGGYKPGKVKVTNIPGLGRAVYNDNETIKSFPGLSQPAIMPPQNSSAGQKYQRNFYGKHGFNPYMAGGNIPNFASKKIIGGGFYGSFSQYVSRPNLGFKSFKPGIPDSYILKELENSKVSRNLLKKNTLLTVPQVLGSPARTLARRGYGKEFVEEGDLYSILGKLRQKYPDRPDQVRGVMSAVMRLGYGEARKSGISVQDSTYDNIGSKGGLFNFASKYMDNPDNFDSWGLPKIKTAELKKELVKSGIKLSLLDLGDVKYRGEKGFSKGLVPNFANFDFLKKDASKFYSSAGSKYILQKAVSLAKKNSNGTINLDSFIEQFKEFGEHPFESYPSQKHPFTPEMLKDPEHRKAPSPLGFRGASINELIAIKYGDKFISDGRNNYGEKRDITHFASTPKNALGSFGKRAGYGYAVSTVPLAKRTKIFGADTHTAYHYGANDITKSDVLAAFKINDNELEFLKDFFASSGSVPNFSGLSSAIKRESMSVPESTIRVGSDSRLKSSQNPNGLGVYNTIHEPNGLSQGITRAYSEGLNPKTYNVPNFVPPSRFVRGDFGIESGSGIPANVYKQIQSDIKKNLRDLFSEFEKGSLSARKMTDKLEELKVQFNLTDSSLLKAKSAFSKFKKEVQIDRDFENALGLTPKTVSGQFAKSQMGAIGAQRAAGAQSRVLLAGNLGMFNQISNPDDYRQYKGLMNQFNPENYRYQVELENARSKSQSTRGEIVSNVSRSRIFNPIGQSTVFSQEVEKNRKEYYDQQRIQRKLDEIKKKRNEEELKMIKAQEMKRDELSSKITSLRQKADSFNFLGSGRAIKEANKLQQSGAITKEEVEALKGLRNNRIQTAAGLGSFLVPTVLTPALQGISDNKKYQAGVETVSSTASLALTGLSVGATMGANGGPIGAAIGGAFGLLTSLPGLLKAIRDPLPNLLEDLQKLQESFSRSSANLQQYSALTDKLSEVYSGAIKNVSISDIKKLESERAQTFSNLDPKIKSLIEKAGEDTSKINEIIGAYTSSRQSQLNFGKILDEVKNTKLLRESDTFVGMQAGFGGMAAQTITTPNYKNIGKNQKTLDELSKNLYSGLIGLKNIESGKNVFDMAKENTGLQSLFGSIQSFEGLKAVFESINNENALEDFIKQFSDFEAVIKSQDPRVFEELKKRIVESLSPEGMKQAIANNEKYKVAEKEKNKIIDDSINKLLQFNSSLLKFSSDLQVINQKGLLDLDFKINSEKLRMNVQNTLESLNAGDYQKASIKFRENAQENIQKQDLSLFNSKIQTNQEYVEKLSEFQSNFLKSGLKDVTEINKGSPSQLRQAIDDYQTRIFSFFEKAGLSNIDVKNLDKKKIDELLKNLTDKSSNFASSSSSSGPEMSGLKESELNELLKTLPELRINLEKAQRDQQARDEVIRYQFEKAGLLNTEEKRAQFGIIGGANFDALTKLQNSNRFDIGQTRISANFERNQQLQKLRDDFALSNLSGAGRLNKQFEINQRNIVSQSNFESSNLLPKLLQREGVNNLQFNEVGTKISTKEQLDNEIKIREEKSKGKEISVNERDILTALKRVQEDFISGQEKIVISKENSLELSKETLKIEKELLKYRFQEERIADNLKNIEGRIKEGRGISGGDIKSVIKEQFNYTPRDFQRDAILGVNEVSATIKTSFSGAISSIIKDGKSFGDAFREMLLGVLNKIVDKTSDITTNLLFNGISSAASSFAQGKNAGGLIKGYSNGGKVTGGSGIRDDVPAMLTDGEYVIKKSAAEAIGKANLDKINYGNDSVAFNLKNDYTYNDPKFPTSGKLDVSSALSNFGLMDTSISRANELRLEKEQNLISYLEQKRNYDKNVGDAMRAFRQQKRNRLYGAYLSAAAGVAGAGLSSAFGPTAGSGASKGVDFNGFQNTGFRMAATGGLIQKFANGGHVFGGNSITDTVPAMLTGGEYVIKKDKVNKFGKNFFDNLNNSSPRKYADGGLVTPALAPINTNKGINTDLTIQFNSLTNAINNLSNSIKPNTNKDNYGINNYITVSVSVDSQNGVTTESSVNSQSKGNTRNENDQNQVEKLRKGLENDMGAFINKQMKQGGTIYTFVNSRIGR